jgi:hypothetical protein
LGQGQIENRDPHKHGVLIGNRRNFS